MDKLVTTGGKTTCYPSYGRLATKRDIEIRNIRSYPLDWYLFTYT